VRSDCFFVRRELSSGPLEWESGKEVSEDLRGGRRRNGSATSEGDLGKLDKLPDQRVGVLRQMGWPQLFQQVRQKGSLHCEDLKFVIGRGMIGIAQGQDGLMAAVWEQTAHWRSFANLPQKVRPIAVTVLLAIVQPHQTVPYDTLKGIWQVVEASRVIPGLLGSGGGEGRHDGLVVDAGEQDPVRVFGACLGERKLRSRGGEEEVLAAGQEGGVEEDDLGGIAALTAGEGLLQVEPQVRGVRQPAATEKVIRKAGAAKILQVLGEGLLMGEHGGSSCCGKEKKKEKRNSFRKNGLSLL